MRSRRRTGRLSSPSRSTGASSPPAGSFCSCTRGAYRNDPTQSAEWNRGAYLVEGLGHCGSCHTPRNKFGAEEKSRRFAGGEAENWDAPALNAASAAPVPWTADQLTAYLKDGFADQHGFAAGPMQPVTLNLRKAPDADVRAIATYIASINGAPDAAARQRQTEAALTFAAQRATTVGAMARTTTGVAASEAGSPGAASVRRRLRLVPPFRRRPAAVAADRARR